MDFRKYAGVYYIRLDRGDEMIASILELCRKEGIRSCTYSGIGGCSSAEIQTFVPEKGEFRTERLEGMLELVSFMGNVISDEGGKLYHHTHALYTFVRDGGPCVRGGHLKASTVLYTAELELRPVEEGTIGYKLDPETGTGFWRFQD